NGVRAESRRAASRGPEIRRAMQTAGASAPPVQQNAFDTFEAVPLFSQSAWYPMTMPAAPTHQPSALLAVFPGPYSPLVVTPPAHRSVRTVSTEYAPID
ncbi:MAG TPA: hypothetical protein VHG09_03635, partial [Longimicrobiales bacterium]|nr:hypothetical protein [Longimicrobiales bacterium]